jgi:hypothetical protein
MDHTHEATVTSIHKAHLKIFDSTTPPNQTKRNFGVSRGNELLFM